MRRLHGPTLANARARLRVSWKKPSVCHRASEMDEQVETDRFGGATRDRGRGCRYLEFTCNESRQFECLEAEQGGGEVGEGGCIFQRRVGRAAQPLTLSKTRPL